MPTSAPLLMTKLHAPPTRVKLISRPRLFRQLVAGLTRPLTLISAPAGFGKTTLLGEWCASEAGRACPPAWLSLDAEDNDPARFFTYLVAALQTLYAPAGETALALLQSTPPPGSSKTDWRPKPLAMRWPVKMMIMQHTSSSRMPCHVDARRADDGRDHDLGRCDRHRLQTRKSFPTSKAHAVT